MRKKENWQLAALLLGFIALNLWYFAVQQLLSPKVMVHVPLDDYIPFCEWFVIPYVVWYAYVFLAVVFFFFRDRASLMKLGTMIVAGMGVCLTIYTLCPNGIEFRPETFPRDNILTDLVGLLYRQDRPENVFPSIHVLNALAVHMAVRESTVLRKYRWVKGTSLVTMILICMSTVFIKQHSVLDIFGGVALCLALYPVIYRRKTRARQEA